MVWKAEVPSTLLHVSPSHVMSSVYTCAVLTTCPCVAFMAGVGAAGSISQAGTGQGLPGSRADNAA